MLLIIQIAIGVCTGLWLFRWIMTRPPRQPRPPRDWVKASAAFASATIFVLWLLHFVLMAAR
jgi:hypothetical protein